MSSITHQVEHFFRNVETFVSNNIVLVVLFILFLAILPIWPHSSRFGYGPSGLTGLILFVIIFLLLTGRI